MAYKRRVRRMRKSKPKYTELEKLAYNMGKVKKGIANPESRVHESYRNGLQGKSKRKKKPLI